jgi:hypothetical protein
MTDNPLADRVAALEALVASLAAQVEELTITGPPGPPADTGTDAGEDPPRRRFDTPEQWVDRVYTVLAAGQRLPWCPRWWEHAEVYERITYLWQSWETAMVASVADDAAMAVWLRDQFDHHRAVLQGRDGPFADCHTGHRGTAAWLDITDPTPNRDEFTLDDAARLFFNRATPPGPMTVTDQAEADYQAAAAQFFATDPKERP